MNQDAIDAANQQEIEGLRENRAELITENQRLKRQVVNRDQTIKKLRQGMKAAIDGMKAIETDTG